MAAFSSAFLYAIRLEALPAQSEHAGSCRPFNKVFASVSAGPFALTLLVMTIGPRKSGTVWPL